MHLLVVVFALSVVVLLAAAWAIRRSIQRHGRKKEAVGLGLGAHAQADEGSAESPGERDDDEHDIV